MKMRHSRSCYLNLQRQGFGHLTCMVSMPQDVLLFSSREGSDVRQEGQWLPGYAHRKVGKSFFG